MPAREYLLVVQESAFLTPAALSVGTNASFIRLSDGSFNMVAVPTLAEIPYGGGFAVPAEMIADHYACAGQLKTKLYGSQAKFLMGWATTRINGAQTAPWTTTEPPGDLASCSVYHAVQNPDNATYRLKRFAGTKVNGVSIEVSRDATVAMITLDLLAAQEFGNAMEGTVDPLPAEFPPPAETDYPVGPYTFHQTAGFLSVGGATRTLYDDLRWEVRNALDGRWFEAQHLAVTRSLGRRTTLNSNLMLKSSPDDRPPYEGVIAQAVTFGMHNGVAGQNMTVTMNAQNTITGLPYNLPMANIFMQPITITNRWDPLAAGDITVSFA
jgi:hypothetical protein